jgi:hypothetical protein
LAKRETFAIQDLGENSAKLEVGLINPYPQAMVNTLEALCVEIRNGLLARRQRIAEEIARHPRPITACDVHFNRLLEERALLSEEIDRFDQFVASSALLTAEAKERIRSAAENGVCP